MLRWRFAAMMLMSQIFLIRALRGVDELAGGAKLVDVTLGGLCGDVERSGNIDVG